MSDTSPTPTSDEAETDFVPTPDEGPANPQAEPIDHQSSPPGGRGYDDDEVAVDPEDAPSANSFLLQIIIGALMVVVLLTVAAITGSDVLLVVALLSIIPGIALVVHAIFKMMSTD
ncbi:hypothetical protein [Patulibacter defluvii]|uniref:hypothetical protein n=1 Tax=Patulibacter defluvii TaxID=3095358 RepID=UPI002A74B417|nr:hypothetical protein [Patulibacter sp. DM4]